MAIARQRFLMGDDTTSRGYGSGPGAHGASGASDPSADPLSELARLIGQSDPFAIERQRGVDPRSTDPHAEAREWHLEPQQARGESYDAPGDSYDEHGYGAQYPDEPYGESADDRAYGPGGFAAYEAGEQEAEQYDDQSYYEDEQPRRRRRGWLPMAAAFLGLAAIGTAGAFAYRAVFSGGPPSVIARDPGPNKIVPANHTADGRTNNKRVDRIASGGQDERVISREEQPITLPETARSMPAPGAGQIPGPAFPAPPPAIPAAPNPPVEAATSAPASPGNTPAARKIQTVPIRSDGSPADAVGTIASPPSAPARSPAPPRAAAPAQGSSAPSGPLSLTPESVSQPAPAAPPARTSAIAPQHAARDAAVGSGYFVQVSAQRSEAEAQSSYRGIQSKYPDLLGGHDPVIRRKDLGNKGVFYGAQVGPLSHEAAIKLCENLKSAGGSCMIQRN